MDQAKWWGWGDEAISFTHADKPSLAPFLERALGLDVRAATSRPAAFADLEIPESTLSPALRSELEAAVGSARVSTDPLDRVVHGRGKSLRDLVRHRRGDVGRLPDVVVRPGDEDELAAVVRAAIDADAVVIAFGGGTNISGSLEVPADEERDIVSVDLSR
jgi:alkyldihydroxyacetonephosphate synthase